LPGSATLKALRSHYARLGQRLVTERKKLGLSQQGLASATGIQQSEISRIERELVDPRLTTYVKLLAGMGLTLRIEPALGARRTEVAVSEHRRRISPRRPHRSS
jgi:transcriptional regulator with XRE-family HTH domain